MSPGNHHSASTGKQRWARRIITDSALTLAEKKTLLWLSQYADENGTITDPDVNAMLATALHAEASTEATEEEAP